MYRKNDTISKHRENRHFVAEFRHGFGFSVFVGMEDQSVDDVLRTGKLLCTKHGRKHFPELKDITYYA